MNETICIIPQRIGLGGPASFQARFSSVLTARGYKISHDPLDPANNVILVIGGTRQLNLLRQASRNGVRIVQRLNGMNWVHRHVRTGLRHFLRAEVNNFILASIRHMADRIIYQSNFSRDWWQRVRGETRYPGAVIYNGVDLDQFSPLGEGTPPTDHMRILMVEGNLGGGYEGGLDSAVQMIQMLSRRQERKIELMVVGNAPDGLRRQYESRGVEITWRGVVKREVIPAIDRSAHMLFSADVNAACPNSVIEALACGLPVIGYNTGALSELIGSEAGAVAAYGGDPWKLQKPDVHSLADAAQQVYLNLGRYKKAARLRAEEMFDIQYITNLYLDVLFGD